MAIASSILRATDATASVQQPTEVQVRLRDGSPATIRPVCAEDEPRLRVFLDRLCPAARRLRFFTAAVDLRKAAHWAAEAGTGGYGALAYDQAGAILGHAAYVRLSPGRAEVAVEVADHLHGKGLGTMLVAHVAEIAERYGITHFVAEVLTENRAMLDVFQDGFDARVIRHEGPEERVEFLTCGWRLAHERFRDDNRTQ